LLKQDMMRAFASMKQEIERDPFSGILYPGSDPDPAGPPNCVGPSGAVKVFLGSSLAFAPRFPAKLVSLGNGVVLALDKSRDGLLIDAIVTDSDGRMIADIRKNLFTINQNNVFRRERPDKSTIRVIDQFNRQVLYVRYLSSHAVKILGSFTEPVNPGPQLGTGRFTITDEEIVPSGWGVREWVSIKGACGGGLSLMFCLWCIPDSPYMYGTRRPPSSQPTRP